MGTFEEKFTVRLKKKEDGERFTLPMAEVGLTPKLIKELGMGDGLRKLAKRLKKQFKKDNISGVSFHNLGVVFILAPKTGKEKE